jgi:hypothetical protein
MQLSRVSFILYFLSVISFITLSNGVLLLVNYPYADPSSGSIYKVHPALYLSFMSVVFTIIYKKNIAIKQLFFDKNIFLLYLVCFSSLTYTLLVLKQPLAGVAMTWLCPTFMLSLYFQCSDNQKHKIYYACLVITIVNSIIGLYEYAVGQHIVPQYYFSQNEGELLDLSEWAFYRAEALYGHPLTATLCSSLVIIVLVIKSKWVKLLNLEKMCLSLAFLSLPAFGGRFPMAICILTVVTYFLINMNSIFRHGITKRTFILACFILYLIPFVFYTTYELGLFDKLLERIADDNGSAQTRLVAVEILLDTPVLNIIFGDFDKSLFMRQLNYGTIYGIEVSWIAMILMSGIIMVYVYGLYLYKTAKILVIHLGFDILYLFIGFLIMITSGTGLSGKSHSLSLFLIFALFMTFSKDNKIKFGSFLKHKNNIKLEL